MTQQEKQVIKRQINEMIIALDYARDLNEAFEIEEGIIELENKLYRKG